MNTALTLEHSGPVATITLDGSAHPVVIGDALCDQLARALGDISATPAIRVVVLRSTGKAFCVGGDLAQIEQSLADPGQALAALIGRFHQVIEAMRRLPIPIIASVNGAAAGAGFSLAMACDYVLAARSAAFVVGYSRLGTSCDGGLSFHLVRQIGPRAALEVLLLKDSLSALEAHGLGLINQVQDDAALEHEAYAIARRFAAIPAQAVQEMKALVNSAVDADLREQLDRERQAFVRCAGTPEFREKVATFIRAPRKMQTK